MASKSQGKGLPSTPRLVKEHAQHVTFWGVRGTLPTPGHKTLKYGGNTSCVEVAVGSPHETTSIILDAGTGIAKLGDQALERGEREFHIFLSHMHYDHIMGLTRFTPLFRDDCKISFYGQSKCGKSLLEILSSFFSHPFFPLRFEDLPSRKHLHFTEINNLDELIVGSARVKFQSLNHPQDAIAFRVSDKELSTSVVYATDHEHGTNVDTALEEFARNTTLFIYDTTYCEASYPQHKGWGHSTALAGARIAKRAKAHAYAIFHHDPDASDENLETLILPEAVKAFPKSFLSIEEHSLCLDKLASGRHTPESLLTPVIDPSAVNPRRRLTRG